MTADGFVLLTASAGEEAFRLVEEQDPALIVLYWQSPGMAECYRRLKADPLLRGTPVILLATGGVEEAEGNDEVLAHPPERRKLLAAACRLLQIGERAGPRLPVRLPARVGRPGDRPRPVRIRDLGPGGLYLETARLFPVGTALELQFALPASGPRLACRCRVAWVNHPEWVKKPSLPSGMGVEFLDLGAAVQKEIWGFIEKGAENDRESGLITH